MAHNLDINDGTATFLSAREDAWHMLGRTLDHSFTAQEAMDEGLLGGWKIRKEPMFAKVGDLYLPIPNQHAVVRNNPVRKDQQDVLGTVGGSYHIIQNEDHAEFLNALVDESGAHFETAGALEGGRKVFITMKLPGYMQIGGVDTVDNYIAAVNSHDGSMAFTMMVTPVRVVCENTLNMAFGDRKSVFRVRHTRRAGDAIRQQARESLDLTFKYLDGFQEEAERLINTTMTQSRFEEIIEAEFGAKEDDAKGTVTRRQNVVDQMAELFADSFTHEGVRETAWAGLNAMTEYYDHFSGARAGAVGDADASRAVNALFYPEFKDRARKLILAEAGI